MCTGWSLKCGFCKNLLLYECNSDQLSTFFHCVITFGLVQQQSNSKPTRKWATGQSCIRKEVTSYKSHTLDGQFMFCHLSGQQFFWFIIKILKKWNAECSKIQNTATWKKQSEAKSSRTNITKTSCGQLMVQVGTCMSFDRCVMCIQSKFHDHVCSMG